MNENDLLVEYGKLQLERETHIARLRNTEQRMAQIRQNLIELKSKKKNGK